VLLHLESKGFAHTVAQRVIGMFEQQPIDRAADEDHPALDELDMLAAFRPQLLAIEQVVDDGAIQRLRLWPTRAASFWTQAATCGGR
jgi:hypothetical protein